MKILRVVATDFKLCEDNFEINFIPSEKKYDTDKEYELHEIAEGLFTFTTMAFVGKNASGKTTAVNLLALVYDIFQNFRVKNEENSILPFNKVVNLDIVFFYEGHLYRYITDLAGDKVNNIIHFKNQQLTSRKYYKSYSNEIFDFLKYEAVNFERSRIPTDTSILFYLLNDMDIYGVNTSNFLFSGTNVYSFLLEMLDTLESAKDARLKETVVRLFDHHIEDIKKAGDEKYKLCYTDGKSKILSGEELLATLSTGTTRGMKLFTVAIFSLQHGLDLLVDEIENHFHKTIVNNLINLYKEKKINRNSARLIFTTHYCELLDLFRRGDNIYITKHNNKIMLEKISNYDFRTELLKSKRFYQNAFDTNVDYDALMALKKELMK